MNYFVVGIGLDTGITDYKVFGKFTDAKSRYYIAYSHLLDERPSISKTGRQTWIENARLSRVVAESCIEAKEKAERGECEIIEDTELPLEHVLNLSFSG